MKKKLPRFLCTALMTVVCMSVNAQETSGTCGDNATWSYEGTTLTISGTGAMADFAYGGAPWNAYADVMKYVQINEGVTSVGNNAFAGFTALKSVTFPPEGFTSIGEYAFSGCTSFKNLNLPTTLTTIGDGAFSGSAVRGAYIQGSVKKIGDYAFESCSNMEGVSIFEGVEEIGKNAFDGCAFSSVVIPSTVTTIGGGAFMSNTALESIYIGAGVTNIGDATFQGCTALTNVGLGCATTPTLGDAVFDQGDGETLLAIDAFYVPSTTPYSGGWGGYAADKFKTIYEGTWTYHDNNTDTDDPEKGTGTWSFNVTTGELTVNGTGNLNVSPWMGMSAINPELYDNEHPGYWSKVLSFVVGEGITHIQTLGVGMQINCASVTLPSTLKYVGYSCLEECAFTSIELPEGLETIDDYTFFDSKLTSLTIPSTVTYIGSSAFLANEDLATITCLPATPPDLGAYEPCFGDGGTITAIYVPAGSVNAYKNWEWDESIGYTQWNGWKDYSSLIQPIADAPAATTTFTYTATEQVTKFDTYANFTGATGVASHTFDNGAGTVVYEGTVTSLGLRALNSTKLTSITIPESVTAIGERAFADCATLATITFEGTPAITTIGDYAFAGCDALTSFTVPEGVTAIGTGGFQSCDELAAVTIPESVANMSDYVFNNCKKLATVTFTGTPTLAAISSRAFYNCEALTAIAIPAKVAIINSDAFEGCKLLASVTFPASSVLTTIGTAAFQDCKALTTIALPESVTTLGEIQVVGEKTYYNNSIFWGSGLTTFVLPKNVTNIYGGGMFANCPMTSLTVDAANTKYDSRDGANAIFETATDKLVVGCIVSTVPDGTKAIGREAFFAEQQTFSLTLPESVTSIEERAFHYATGLTAINIPSGVTEIGDETFPQCNITELVIPDGVTSIGKMAFMMCEKLEKVTFGTGLTTIDEYAFDMCSNVTDVYCYAAPFTTWNGSGFADSKATQFHVSDADAWSTAFPAAKVTFVGDLVASRPETHAVEKGGVTANWSTYYNSTQDVVADANTEVYQVSLTGTALTLTKVDDRIINAGQGVVLKSTDANIVLLTSDTQSATSYATNSLTGTDTQITNPGNAYVLGYANSILGFHKLSASGTIKAHKAYLTYSGSGAPEFFDLEGNVTGITNTNLSNQTNTNGAVYTLDGRRVSKPTKGLYIVNGKKVVIK